jgi:hypothetical protein
MKPVVSQSIQFGQKSLVKYIEKNTLRDVPIIVSGDPIYTSVQYCGRMSQTAESPELIQTGEVVYPELYHHSKVILISFSFPKPPPSSAQALCSRLRASTGEFNTLADTPGSLSHVDSPGSVACCLRPGLIGGVSKPAEDSDGVRFKGGRVLVNSRGT